MISLAVNGYTAAQVQDAILGKNGVVERRWRFEIYDAHFNLLRETKSVRQAGGLRYAESQPIRRGGTMQISENKFTLTTDYLNPFSTDNEEMELPYLYNQIVNETPYLYCRFGDTSGTTATDASGNSRALTYTGSPTLNQTSQILSAQSDGSFKTNGSSSYAIRSHESGFNVANPFYGIWVKTVSNDYGVIVSRDGYLTVEITSTGYLKVTATFTSGSPLAVTTTAKINNDVAHYVCVGYDAQYLYIFLDGDLLSLTAETRTLASPSAALNVGRKGDATLYLAAYFDELEVYGYCLSAAQVRARWQAGSNQLYEINFLRDYIKPYCAVKMPTAGTDGTYWAEFPRGLYLFTYPDRVEENTGAYYEATIQDLTAKLENTTVSTSNYTIATSVKYREAITTILLAAGFSTGQFSIETSTIAETTLPISKEYAVGTTYLYILNDLAKDMAYRPIRMNSYGILVLQAWVSLANRSTEFTLAADENSIINTQKKQNTNLKDTFNEVFMKRQGAKGVQELVSTKSNNNASHPTSIPRIGKKTFVNLNASAADQTTLDSNASAELEKLSRITYGLKIKCPLLPHADNEDYFRITGVESPPLFAAATAQTPENFLITDYSEPFDDTGDFEATAEFYIAAAA
jgi:hypothetical protein